MITDSIQSEVKRRKIEMGKLLRAYRIGHLTMSQGDLADALGFTQPYVSNIEQGKKNEVTLFAILKYIEAGSEEDRQVLMNALFKMVDAGYAFEPEMMGMKSVSNRLPSRSDAVKVADAEKAAKTKSTIKPFKNIFGE